MRAARIGLVLALVSCAEEPSRGPLSAAETLESGLRDALLGETRRFLEGVPPAVLGLAYQRDDDEQGIVSERIEGPSVQVPLRGAQVHVPLETLGQVSVEFDEDGVVLVLAYGSATATVADRTGSDRARRLFEELSGAESDASTYVPEAAWEALARAVASAGGAEDAVARAREEVGGWDARFRREFRSLAALRAAVLAATPEQAAAGRRIYDVYRRCRLLRLKGVVASGPGEPSLLVCGPVAGVLHRDPAGDTRAFVDGPDDILLEYTIVSRAGVLPPEVLRGLFFARPFSKAGGKNRSGSGEASEPAPQAGSVEAALRAIGAFHLLPRAGPAEAMVRALRLQPRPPSELELLATRIADWIEASDEERARLLLVARGDS